MSDTLHVPPPLPNGDHGSAANEPLPIAGPDVGLVPSPGPVRSEGLMLREDPGASQQAVPLPGTPESLPLQEGLLGASNSALGHPPGLNVSADLSMIITEDPIPQEAQRVRQSEGRMPPALAVWDLDLAVSERLAGHGPQWLAKAN